MFNALRYSKVLEEAGFSRAQAEAAINVFFKFMEYNFASKEDVTKIEPSLKTQIDRVEVNLKGDLRRLETALRESISDLRHEIKALEYKMTIKFGIMQTAAVGLLVAILKLFWSCHW